MKAGGVLTVMLNMKKETKEDSPKLISNSIPKRTVSEMTEPKIAS